MKYYCTLFILFFVLSACSQSKSKGITEVSQNKFNTGVIVDVRTPEEYANGHLENAVNVNWYDTDFTEQFVAIPKNKTIYVYCKKGGRSAKAQEKLSSLGYDVINLEGGYDAYSTEKMK